MATTPLELVPKEGLVLQTGSSFPAEGFGKGFATLLNARLVPGKNQIEQTPCFMKSAWTAGQQYYDSGAAHDDSITNTPRLIVELPNITSGAMTLFYVSDTMARRDTGNGVTLIRQLAVPGGFTVAQTAINSCLGRVFELTALALGDTFTVTIAAAATFTWSLNGGAPVGPVAIAAGGYQSVLLPSGGYFFLYWLAAGGFNPGDAWLWQRTDYTRETGQAVWLENLPYAVVGSDVYFLDSTGRLLVYDSTFGCIHSGGYRPIFGASLAFYSNHLVIGGYSKVYNGNPLRTTNVIATSDNGLVTNLENFLATNANEADEITLLGEQPVGHVLPGHGIFKLVVIRNILYAFSSVQIWGTSYNGLPTPFNFIPVLSANLHPTFRGDLRDGLGVYVMLTNGIGYFDGTSIQMIDEKVQNFFQPRPAFYSVSTPAFLTYTLWSRFTWGFYDAFNQEVYFCYANTTTTQQQQLTDNLGLPRGFLVFQKRTNTWYFRAAEFGTNPVRAGCTVGGQAAFTSRANAIVLGGIGGLCFEDIGGQSASPAYDITAGTAYQIPTIETVPYIVASIQTKVEVTPPVVIDADYQAAGAGYSITGVTIEFSVRERINATKTYDTALAFTTSDISTARMLSYRKTGRVFQVRIKPRVAANCAPFGFVFNALDVNITTPGPAKV